MYQSEMSTIVWLVAVAGQPARAKLEHIEAADE
jgi:hypothetical protein